MGINFGKVLLATCWGSGLVGLCVNLWFFWAPGPFVLAETATSAWLCLALLTMPFLAGADAANAQPKKRAWFYYVAWFLFLCIQCGNLLYGRLDIGVFACFLSLLSLVCCRMVRYAAPNPAHDIEQRTPLLGKLQPSYMEESISPKQTQRQHEKNNNFNNFNNNDDTQR